MDWFAVDLHQNERFSVSLQTSLVQAAVTQRIVPQRQNITGTIPFNLMKEDVFHTHPVKRDANLRDGRHPIDRRTLMKPLTDLLKEHGSEIRRRLHLGYVHWEDLVNKIEIQERAASGIFSNEQVWTFLAGCGYAISGAEGLAKLTNILTGTDLPHPDDAKLWLEVLPLPPRNNERSTHVDLAIGSIIRRGNSRSGINLGRNPQPWICFCEMKWDSDISLSVTYDPDRNQLARVIENALCFQSEGRYSDEVCVALVTPATFKRPDGEYRAYQGMFREYESDRAKLRRDLDACRLGKRDRPDWKYPPDIAERVDRLKLRWPTYEELFAGIPPSEISGGLQRFWEKSGHIR